MQDSSNLRFLIFFLTPQKTKMSQNKINAWLQDVFPIEIPSWELTYPIKNGTFEDDFPFPRVGYVNSLEGNPFF